MTQVTQRSALLTLLAVLMGHLSQVAVVVSLHLQVKDCAVRKRGFGNQVFVEQLLRVKGSNVSGKVYNKSKKSAHDKKKKKKKH